MSGSEIKKYIREDFDRITNFALSPIDFNKEDQEDVYNIFLRQYTIDDLNNDINESDNNKNILVKLKEAGINRVFICVNYRRKDKKRLINAVNLNSEDFNERNSVKKDKFAVLKRLQDDSDVSNYKYFFLEDKLEKYKKLFKTFKDNGIKVGFRIMNEYTDIYDDICVSDDGKFTGQQVKLDDGCEEYLHDYTKDIELKISNRFSDEFLNSYDSQFQNICNKIKKNNENIEESYIKDCIISSLKNNTDKFIGKAENNNLEELSNLIDNMIKDIKYKYCETETTIHNSKKLEAIKNVTKFLMDFNYELNKGNITQNDAIKNVISNYSKIYKNERYPDYVINCVYECLNENDLAKKEVCDNINSFKEINSNFIKDLVINAIRNIRIKKSYENMKTSLDYIFKTSEENKDTSPVWDELLALSKRTLEDKNNEFPADKAEREYWEKFIIENYNYVKDTDDTVLSEFCNEVKKMSFGDNDSYYVLKSALDMIKNMYTNTIQLSSAEIQTILDAITELCAVYYSLNKKRLVYELLEGFNIETDGEGLNYTTSIDGAFNKYFDEKCKIQLSKIKEIFNKAFNTSSTKYIEDIRTEFMEEYNDLTTKLIDNAENIDFITLFNESAILRLTSPLRERVKKWIGDLRDKYKEKLTLSISSTSSDIAKGMDYNEDLFKLIDVVGFTYYPSVNNDNIPSVNEVIDSFYTKELSVIEELCRKHNKKFMIMEYGCCPYFGQAKQPWAGQEVFNYALKVNETLGEAKLSNLEVLRNCSDLRVTANYLKGGCIAAQFIENCCGLALWSLHENANYTWIYSDIKLKDGRLECVFINRELQDSNENEGMPYCEVKKVWGGNYTMSDAQREYSSVLALTNVTHNSKGNPHEQYVGNTDETSISPSLTEYKEYYKLMTIELDDEYLNNSNNRVTLDAEFDVYENRLYSIGVNEPWRISLKLGKDTNEYFSYDNKVAIKLVGKEGRALIGYRTEGKKLYYDVYVKLINGDGEIYSLNVIKKFLNTDIEESRITIYNRAETYDFSEVEKLSGLIYSREAAKGIESKLNEEINVQDPKYLELLTINLDIPTRNTSFERIAGGYTGVWELLVDSGKSSYDGNAPKDKVVYAKFLIFICNSEGKGDEYQCEFKILDSYKVNQERLILVKELNKNIFKLYCRYDYKNVVTFKPCIEHCDCVHNEMIQVTDSNTNKKLSELKTKIILQPEI